MADRERYIEHLGAYRSDGDDPESCATDSWVEYFAQALVSACARAEALVLILDNVRTQWRNSIQFRRGSAGERILQVLTSNPVVTVARAAELTGASGEACRLAIRRLVEVGVLVQNTRNRKSDLYVAQDVVDALTSFERASNTREGRPSAHVPQKAQRRVTLPRLD